MRSDKKLLMSINNVSKKAERDLTSISLRQNRPKFKQLLRAVCLLLLFTNPAGLNI